MTVYPTAREVIAMVGTPPEIGEGCQVGDALADTIIAALDRDGLEIVGKGAVAKEREACASIAESYDLGAPDVGHCAAAAIRALGKG